MVKEFADVAEGKDHGNIAQIVFPLVFLLIMTTPI